MSVSALMALLGRASDEFVLPGVLQPMDVFVELAGEEFRKRLFTTEGADGEALCLRPDFTIPVCLEHLKAGRKSPSAYNYRGKIFRKRRMIGAPEFEQAGTEWIGHTDEIETDAAVFALAMDAAGIVGLKPKIRMGDAYLFGALVDALALPPAWRTRLTAAFGDRDRLTATLARLTRRDVPDGLAARLAPALARVDPTEARAIVDAVIGLPQHATTSGRSADDIAARLLEQAAGNGGHPQAARIIEEFCEIAVPLVDAVATLRAFAQNAGVDLSAAIDVFAARADALTKGGVSLEDIGFEAGFGRRLNYYTGFVFDMIDPAEPLAEVIAGGRYDTLMALLDPEKSLPAIGFSVWLDRIPEPI
ncbi:ATP phosphoribosyltransferase regulatory subunit [Acuticoccus sp. MNP-M23]|uniref:ATP phosphoribosyltransferase regulatory subunit n=1 Tax=Acuticoccus sp. MNP-M23 TaxID=3072793 RepID=UPI0028160876|nr:ATP phosphoribosyltransferase regulatory subunit [Acuticoccus sp. MNP-M23]WMS44113.1 ATP phosphoribosyltransferase regulatory subunit [Acuticoccus sp. MNP-M23]